MHKQIFCYFFYRLFTINHGKFAFETFNKCHICFLNCRKFLRIIVNITMFQTSFNSFESDI